MGRSSATQLAQCYWVRVSEDFCNVGFVAGDLPDVSTRHFMSMVVEQFGQRFVEFDPSDRDTSWASELVSRERPGAHE